MRRAHSARTAACTLLGQAERVEGELECMATLQNWPGLMSRCITPSACRCATCTSVG